MSPTLTTAPDQLRELLSSLLLMVGGQQLNPARVFPEFYMLTVPTISLPAAGNDSGLVSIPVGSAHDYVWLAVAGVWNTDQFRMRFLYANDRPMQSDLTRGSLVLGTPDRPREIVPAYGVQGGNELRVQVVNATSPTAALTLDLALYGVRLFAS